MTFQHQLIFFQESLKGIKLGNAVVVFKTDKTTTTIVDELKRMYDICENISHLQLFPQEFKSAYHSLVFNSHVDEKDNLDFKLTVDNKGSLCGTGNANLFTYSQRHQLKKCRQCGKPGKPRKVLFFPAVKPTIVIHIKNNSQIKTALKYEIAECLNVLVTLKNTIILKQIPIKQVIITKTIEKNVMASKTKIIVDGQTLYDGLSKFEFFSFVENPLCLQCDPCELNHSDPDVFD